MINIYSNKLGKLIIGVSRMKDQNLLIRCHFWSHQAKRFKSVQKIWKVIIVHLMYKCSTFKLPINCMIMINIAILIFFSRCRSNVFVHRLEDNPTYNIIKLVWVKFYLRCIYMYIRWHKSLKLCAELNRAEMKIYTSLYKCMHIKCIYQSLESLVENKECND